MHNLLGHNILHSSVTHIYDVNAALRTVDGSTAYAVVMCFRYIGGGVVFLPMLATLPGMVTEVNLLQY